MFKRVIKKVFFFSFIVTMYSSYAQNSSGLKSDSSPLYLDPSQPTEKRIADLMGRMTLEDKVYQMNQFVIPYLLKSSFPLNRLLFFQ